MDRNSAFLVPFANLGLRNIASQHQVDGLGDILVNLKSVLVLNLDQRVECRRRFSLEDGLLSSSTPSFFVRQSDRMNTPNEIRQRRIDHQVLERVSVDGRNELYSAFRDRSRR